MRTVTTRQNSLKQGKNDAIFPVTMNGKDDSDLNLCPIGTEMFYSCSQEHLFDIQLHYAFMTSINYLYVNVQ
jgi:hypothetical protein